MKLCIFLISIFSLSYGAEFNPPISSENSVKTSFKEVSKDSLLYFYTWGFAPKTYTSSCEKQLQEKYGFAYKVVAACVVSEKQLSTWMTHNKEIRNNLNEKWGKDWEENYNKAAALCEENKQE